MSERQTWSAVFGFLLAALAGAAAPPSAFADHNGYSYVRVVEGGVSLVSQVNGRVSARQNLPVATGDEIVTSEGARTELALADGNVVQVAGESRVRFDAVAGESGTDVKESVVFLEEGSLAAESVPSGDDRAFRIDTEDASIYLPESAFVRVNYDERHGTVVVVRNGDAEVQTRTGSYTVHSGYYILLQGEEQPEITRGIFSRDRFDIWTADRLGYEQKAPRSASSRYVENDYDNDVEALDSYGSWQYSPTYETHVWRPRISAGWSPYYDGYWYWTPVGLSWVSYEPWGWFPYHYGSWFFDASLGWCWAPAYVYSPAWVYWAYTPYYVGWCPIGYFSYFSPYYGAYYRYWGYPSFARGGFYVAVNGVFSVSAVDFRAGWSFLGVDHLGTAFTHGAVVPVGTVAARLGTSVAISSDPLIVNPRASGTTVRTALANFVRTAPSRVSRVAASSGMNPAVITPFLSRQRNLPQQTVSAISHQVARADRGTSRLAGPAAGRLDPGLVARSRGTVTEAGPITASRATERGRATEDSWRGRAAIAAHGSERSGRLLPSPGSSGGRTSDAWRGGGLGNRPAEAVAPRESGRGRVVTPDSGTSGRSRANSPRSESRFAEPESGGRGNDSWRRRGAVPPAQRVIEGIDRGRVASPRAEMPHSEVRGQQDRASEDWRLRAGPAESAPPSLGPRDSRSHRTFSRPVEPERPIERREFREEPRNERIVAPAPRSDRAEPVSERPAAPPRPEFREAPASRFEPPAPREVSRPAPHSEGPRSAPAPRSSPPPSSRDRGGRHD